MVILALIDLAILILLCNLLGKVQKIFYALKHGGCKIMEKEDW